MGWRRKGEEEPEAGSQGLKVGLRQETKMGLGQELGWGKIGSWRWGWCLMLGMVWRKHVDGDWTGARQRIGEGDEMGLELKNTVGARLEAGDGFFG